MARFRAYFRADGARLPLSRTREGRQIAATGRTAIVSGGSRANSMVLTSTQRARGRRAICGFNICNNDPCFLKECRCRDLGSLSRTWACSHIARKRQIGAPRCKCSRRGNGRIGLGVIVPIKIRKRINRAEMFNAERPVSLPARPSRTRVVEWPWSSAMNATPPKPDVPLPYLSRLKFDVSREEGALPFQFVGHVGFS